MMVESVLAPGGTATIALLLFRVTGLMAVAPVFSARAVPLQFKAGVTVLLVLLTLPWALAQGGGSGLTAGGLASELVVGFTIGLAAGILVHAAEVAGDFVAVQTGLSGANLLDPLSETQMPVLGHFLGLVTATALVTLGGLEVIIESVVLSLEAVPPGRGIHLDGLRATVGSAGFLFVLGLRMAAPVIAAVTIGNVALGVLARTVPQFNVLMTAFPLQIGVGLLMLSATIPLLAGFVIGWPEWFQEVAGGLLLQHSSPSSGADP